MAGGAQDTAIAKIQDALVGFPSTRTPISIRHAAVGGQASLKRFKTELAQVLATPEPGVRVISYEGVSVVFEVHHPFEIDMPVVVSWGQRISMGSEADLVKNAVNEKLGRYKQPLIVALDLVGLGDGFRAVTDALLGNEVYRIPIDLENGGAAGPTTLGRSPDGVLAGSSANALRAREGVALMLIKRPLEQIFEAAVG